MASRVILERDVQCTLRDGTTLATDVYRPDNDEKCPVILQRTAYDKTLSPVTWMVLDPTKLALSGYAVAIQDVRGRWASGGEFAKPYATEAEDGYDAVQWAASQPWSDGNVATYGVSFMGGVQWLAAAAQPPALRALAPVQSPDDFVDMHFHRGGALQLGMMVGWHMVSIGPNALIRRFSTDIPKLFTELTALVEDIDTTDESMRALPLTPFGPIDERGGGIAPWFSPQIAAGNSAASAGDSSGDYHAAIKVPAFQIAGWYDVTLGSDLHHFAAMRSGAGSDEARKLTKLMIGPWGHGVFVNIVGDLNFGFRSSGNFLDLREDMTGLHRRWFDARLKGVPGGIDDEPPVKIFVMGRNRWRTEDEWPPARAKFQRWHLHAGGQLSERPPTDSEPSVFHLDPENPVTTRGGNHLLITGSYPRGPVVQSRTEEHPDVLPFTSDPLAKELEVTGPVRLSAWIAAETEDTDLVARLCDVHPDGRSYNVVDGILRLSFRESLKDPRPLVPGEPTQVDVDLWSTSHVFLPGHRLRLHICASDFPRYDRCPGTGESSAVAEKVVPQRNVIFHDPQRPSHVELSVVEG